MKHLKSIRLLWLTGLSFFCLGNNINAQQWNPNHSIGSLNGSYNYAYNQTPSQLVELRPAAIPNTGLNYQWEQSDYPTTGFAPIAGATQSAYSPGVVTQTKYYKRKTTYIANGNYIYSNSIKISLVSATWEDMNYVREHNVITTGITSWLAVDQLAIGQKLQTTTYVDGLGRGVEKVSRESATPANQNNLWGDIVQFSEYDVYGREPKTYLPYTTTTQSGKFKTSPQSEQTAYYANPATYNETNPYSTVTYDGSPLKRVVNIKDPGWAWATSAGSTEGYDMNDAAENVRVLYVEYEGSLVLHYSPYSQNSLYKMTTTDENGKREIEYINQIGQIILKKIELDENPSVAHAGWICTYFVYDHFGRLCYQLQPEAVKYLDENGWSFSGTNGQKVLNEWCFQYKYDEKGRTIWKKAPGAAPLNMLYDARDRMVFEQDGNQAAFPTPQWTASLYDEFDRPVVSFLYNTALSISSLQNDINNAAAISTVSISNQGTATYSGTVTLNPVSSSNLNNPFVTNVLKYLFYDNYSFPLVKTFNTNFTNLSAYNTSDPNVRPIAKTTRTVDMGTGSLTRVLGTNNFLASTAYYDERGSLIQVLDDNIKSGTDINTMQYHFDGRTLSYCSDHTTANTGYTNFKILTKHLFDKVGRVSSIQKQFGSNAFKTISSYDYDDVGRVKTKHLDPNYNGGDLESLNYSYNIHNHLTGINKDYALKTPGSYSKWGHFFGLYIGFDNRDNVFAQPRLNGQVTGLLWNTQGDDAQRKYNYSYDNAGRLTNAVFAEKQTPSDSWSNAKMDFSVSGIGGKISYDLNSNLLGMLHKGVIPGTSAPVEIDNLQYTYDPYSNKLFKVTDITSIGNNNGKFGDFKDGTNGGANDYVYDNNGNLVIDLNKNAKDLNNQVGANGIHYNHLDKPDQIRVAGKGTINIVYTADGEKLQTIYTPETGTPVTTSYINQFIYKADVLQYIYFENGRIRVITPTTQNNGYDALTIDGNIDLPNGKKGSFDYFITDYQQNVRMILTEETYVAGNTCTMETTRATAEEPIFGQTGGGNEVAVTRYPSGSTNWQNASIGSSVSRLGNTAGRNIGPNTLQKVMAGDNVVATVQYYHQSNASGYNPSFLSNLLNSFLQTLSTGNTTGTVIHENAGNITNQLNINGSFLSAVQPSTNTGSTPLAYLTVLFFDERFNFIDAANGGAFQQQVASSVTSAGASLTLTGIKAPKNGYCFVYVSNQSNQDVFFDNLAVTIAAGNIIEEDHYYSYGLKIASISSTKYAHPNEGNLANKDLYNDKELIDEADLNWYDYGFRNYDPQIGRFVQLDPLAWEYPLLTPYQYASCDPITNIDVDGLEGVTAVAETAKETGIEVIVKTTIKKAHKGGGLFAGIGRFFSGAWDGITETVEFAVNVFNPDLEKNSLVQTGKFLYKTVTDPVGTFNNIKTAIQNIDWKDPATYGKALTMIVTPGAGLKAVKYISKAIVSSRKAAILVRATEVAATTEKAAVASDAAVVTEKAVVATETAAETSSSVASNVTKTAAVLEEEQGGLNLFKFGQPQTETAVGWKTGDRMLKLYDKGSPKLNWKQNSGYLRREMRYGKPIYDSYRIPGGNYIPTKGFLNAERNLLISNGWTFDISTGAWRPPLHIKTF